MASNEHKGLVPVLEQIIGGSRVAATDGRDLHKALGVRKDFSDWAKQQVARLRLVQERDYREEVFPLQGVNPKGGRPAGTYWFTLDAAKHIAMMANTDRGFEVREYFLECERRLHHQTAPNQSVIDPVPTMLSQDPAWAAWLALPAEERRVRQKDVLIYKQLGGTPLMRWAAWNVGQPIPPRYLLGVREQFEMELQRRHHDQGQSVLITVNPVGGTH